MGCVLPTLSGPLAPGLPASAADRTSGLEGRPLTLRSLSLSWCGGHSRVPLIALGGVLPWPWDGHPHSGPAASVSVVLCLALTYLQDLCLLKTRLTWENFTRYVPFPATHNHEPPVQRPQVKGSQPPQLLCVLLPGGHSLPAEWGPRPQLRHRDGAPRECGRSH